ncbi:MerR family transcriptional regulator [Cellulomonas soli]|uniref:MerR family transcriptional regulator n=1 Tax=Cellulomonas soli TaxID=931535 RepID=UPI003F86675E
MAGRTGVGAHGRHIGEVAEITGLSLRTIRHYDEVGLVVPSARSRGGFRQYADDDVDRLQLVRRMKPLGFSLEEMRDLLEVLDGVDGPLDAEEHRGLVARLREYEEQADRRCEELRATARAGEEFAALLRAALERHAQLPGHRP